MSHPAQLEYVKRIRSLYPSHFTGRRVLEVGSRIVNGTVRDLFDSCHYFGLDLGPGPGVDEVCHVADMIAPSLYFDTVISCEALEHDRRWTESLVAMYALVKSGGLLLITCAGPGREEHGTHKHGPESSPYTLDWYKALHSWELERCLPGVLVFDCTWEDTRGYAVLS